MIHVASQVASGDESDFFLKKLLDENYDLFNAELDSSSHPDPLMVVKENLGSKYLDELAFICAMLSYGNASAIVKTLRRFPFESLSYDKDFDFPYYRFQTSGDLKNFAIVMRNVIDDGGMKDMFVRKYFSHGATVVEAIYSCIEELEKIVSKFGFQSPGMSFLIGNSKNKKSPLKRWNMFLRWMVRRDNLDLGRWDEVNTARLILPLDTHTFSVCKKLDILKRKTYDIKSALEVTNKLLEFDPVDPVRYDFSLYRIGQLGLIDRK